MATVAAMTATVGDFLLLYTVGARSDDLGLVPIGGVWLRLGGVLGVFAIPMYAIGYRAAASLIVPASMRAAQTVVVSGVGAAVSGAVIHGLMTAHIASNSSSRGVAADPVASIANGGTSLIVLWAFAAFCVTVASMSFSWYVGGGRTSVPRGAALANPALVTMVLVAAALPFAFGRAFVAPAAPNLAHLIFFAVCARVSDPARIGRGARIRDS